MTRHLPQLPPYFTKRELIKLMLLCGTFVIILTNFKRIVDPANWQSIGALGTVETQLAEPKPEIDSSLAEIVNVDSVETPKAAAPLPAEPSAPAQKSSDENAQVNPLKLFQIDECREINRELMESVRDREPDRSEERAAIWQILCVAATTPPAKLAAEARRDVFFRNLWGDPDYYRGKPIHVKGVLRRLTMDEGKEEKNPYGIRKFYSAWIFPEDQHLNPMLVLLTQLPPGLECSISLNENVSVDAYFFKVFRYKAEDQKQHGAPLLIGHTMKWYQVKTDGFGDMLTFFATTLVGLIFTIAIVFWYLGRRDEQLANQIRSNVSRPADMDDILSGAEFNSPEDLASSTTETANRSEPPLVVPIQPPVEPIPPKNDPDDLSPKIS